MAPSLKSSLTQAFPPRPVFTEKNVPDLTGKVYIVTGANTGTGKELTRLLYSRNAKVYMLARSEEKTNAAIADIRKVLPTSTGSLVFLPLDLADLSTIKATAEQFLAREPKLHVLFNNAGVMSPAREITTTKQGHELHVGVNVLGTFLLTRLLTPRLMSTAEQAEVAPGTVRVVWVASSAAELFAEKNVGIRPETLSPENLKAKSGNERYWLSKVGNWAHGAEYARRHRGVVSVPLNPGNLQSDLYRDQGLVLKIATKLIMYPPVNGAYTELYGGLSPEITVEKSGCWVVPFGRIYPIRDDLTLTSTTEAEGGIEESLKKFWEWSEAQVKPYL
ncbi:short-chain alcohol dehydrogenase [Gnomoniopsis smithogilvyi]|uniref:Short-chain alcohol dehydrogenase n=1 Tax=Gnomoniopsis smithogilvyi TaxID=1191159 RepID=A0A9W8YTE5_9PEZI|nr:short-chain alcohol dehydrogenase [Gnomoniopsis smithogilvyi]